MRWPCRKPEEEGAVTMSVSRAFCSAATSDSFKSPNSKSDGGRSKEHSSLFLTKGRILLRRAVVRWSLTEPNKEKTFMHCLSSVPTNGSGGALPARISFSFSKKYCTVAVLNRAAFWRLFCWFRTLLSEVLTSCGSFFQMTSFTIEVCRAGKLPGNGTSPMAS